MTDWFDKLVNAFFSFKYAYNWVCRFHRGAHWQDKVATNRDNGYLVSEWKLHGHTIAELYKPLRGSAYRLVLKDAGYPTLTTVSRLNGILWYLRERMNIENSIEFRLKYNKGFGIGCTPIHTYIVIDGRKFRVNTVELVIDVSDKRLLAVYVDEDKEVKYVMDDDSIESIRRAYRQINKMLPSMHDVVEQLQQRDGEKAMTYREELLKIEAQFNDAVKSLVEEGGVMYGVYVKRMEDAVKLIDLVKELRKLYREAKQALAYTMLTQ
jgi:hypothetical protein